MRSALTILALLGAFPLFSQQEFRVQVAAFADTISANYFRDRGLPGVYENTDQHGIHRFFLGTYASREAAEIAQADLINKGFPNAQILDLEEQKALCGIPCPYFSGNTVYAEDSASRDAVRTIYFDFGKSTLSVESMGVLEEVFRKMKANPKLRLAVLGHSDAVGPAKQNLEMSIRRARMARNHIISRGIHSTRINVKVYGEAMPVEENTIPTDQPFQGKGTPPDGKKSDRRVVLVLIDEGGEVAQPSKIGKR